MDVRGVYGGNKNIFERKNKKKSFNIICPK